MSQLVKIYEVELEVTDSSVEVVYYVHRCRNLPRTFKSKDRMFNKDTEGKVTTVMAVANHMRFRTWTRQEELIPEMHEVLRLEAVKRITLIQNQVQHVYSQVTKISRDTPPVERSLGWRA